MLLRDATPDDSPAILELNARWVASLSPLTLERLDAIGRETACRRVVVADGDIAAFLWALREGAAYDSPNYRWFQDRYDRFLYIDRVVVDEAWQGRGLGVRLYADLFSLALQSRIDRIACEFDLDPPNESSRRFHERQGFEEVGTQTLACGKRVSMQMRRL